MLGEEFALGLQQGKNEAQAEIDTLKKQLEWWYNAANEAWRLRDEHSAVCTTHTKELEAENKRLQVVEEQARQSAIAYQRTAKDSEHLHERIKDLENTCMAYWVNRELAEEKISQLEAKLGELEKCTPSLKIPEETCDGLYADFQGCVRPCSTYEGCGIKGCKFRR